MGKIGKDRAYISASAPKELVTIIDARANALGWSRAQYTVAVLMQWAAEGAKPVSKVDETMAPEVMDALRRAPMEENLSKIMTAAARLVKSQTTPRQKSA